MRKSKILGIALAAALVSSFATVGVSAVSSASELSSHTMGLTGSFCSWGTDPDTKQAIPDVPMTDEDGDGVWEGTIVIDSVTEGMILDQTTDLGPKNGGETKTGKSGVCFKVRLDGAWDSESNWGEYEQAYNRTLNSQTNCCVECAVGDALTIKVKLDTNTVHPDQKVDDPDDFIAVGSNEAVALWPVTYTVEKGSAESSVEESSDTSVEESSDASVEESNQTPAEESSETPVESSTTPVESSTTPVATSDDASTVPTGDTTSAVALVAVVIASLGAAVVMTKKASSKE